MQSWGRQREVEKPLSEMGVRERRAKLHALGVKTIERLDRNIEHTQAVLGIPNVIVTQLQDARDLLALMAAEFSTEAKKAS